MRPKEKAKELVIKYQEEISIIMARKCSLIAVNEILSSVIPTWSKQYKYWQEVKKEIENIKINIK